MSGTPAGWAKAQETMSKKYGGAKGLKHHFQTIGRVGGKNGKGHTFAHGKVDPHEAGKVGGKLGKRKKAIKSEGKTEWRVVGEKRTHYVTMTSSAPISGDFKNINLTYPLKPHGTFSKLIMLFRKKE